MVKLNEQQYQMWRDYYNRAYYLGKIIRDQTLKMFKTGKQDLKDEELKSLQAACDEIVLESTIYLDSIGIKAPAVKWRYDAKDETTHASSPAFAYSYLL